MFEGCSKTAVHYIDGAESVDYTHLLARLLSRHSSCPEIRQSSQDKVKPRLRLHWSKRTIWTPAVANRRRVYVA